MKPAKPQHPEVKPLQSSSMDLRNGKLFLFYPKSDEAAIKEMRAELLKADIIPIACDDPSKYKFMSAQVVSASNLDLIGNIALQCLDGYNSNGKFVKLLQQALCTEPELPK